MEAEMNKRVFLIVSIAVLMFTLGVMASSMNLVASAGDILDETRIAALLPIVFRNHPAPDVPDAEPPGVLFVFPSTVTTDGNAGGRSSIMEICPETDPDSHFCSVYEIESAWASTGVVFADPFTNSWVDFPKRLATILPFPTGASYPLSEWRSLDYDCSSWTNNSGTSGNEGSYIFNNASGMSQTACSNDYPIACCKRIP
jgi:hypothetical protein